MCASEVSDWTAENLVGGHPVLDFVNTAGGRTKARDIERLNSFHDILTLCEVAGLMDADESETLARDAAARPLAAQDFLRDAVGFREALHTVLIAKQAGEALPESELHRVEEAIRFSLSEARLVSTNAGLRWLAKPKGEPLLLPFVRIGLAAHDLLTDEYLERLRNCERCSWLFLDRGRGKPRRWCSMAACGNRAKAARHYARKRRRTKKDN